VPVVATDCGSTRRLSFTRVTPSVLRAILTASARSPSESTLPVSVTTRAADVSTSMRHGFNSGFRKNCDWTFEVIHAGERPSRSNAGLSGAWCCCASALSPAGRIASLFSMRVTPSTPRAICSADVRSASVSTLPFNVTTPSLVSTSIRWAFTSLEAKYFA
jgi:hypothetical protein